MHKQTCDILLRAALIVTQDEKRRVIESGALAVNQGKVAAIGPASEISAQFEAAQTIDLGQAMILPGLINAHTHAAMTMFRGLADDLPLNDWLTRHIWPVEKELTPEIVRLGSLIACAEMIKSGTTCFLDMYFFTRETARAASQCGMRAVVGEGVIDHPTCSYADSAHAFSKVIDIHDHFIDDPLIRPAVVAHSIYATNPDSLIKCAEISNKYGSAFTLHLAETEWETKESLSRFGKRPLALLEDLGLLGPKRLFAHCVHLEDAEIELLAESKSKVAHCPQSNAKLASGTARIERMRKAGVGLALGTDGAASNNSLNMFIEMRAASLAQKNLEGDPTALPAQAVLDMATRGGAEAVGWPQIGRLEVGAPADLIGLDLSEPGLTPLYNPASHLVYAASGAEVGLSMVAGKVIYRQGKFSGLDWDGLAAEIADLTNWVKKHIA